jgi:hypothetical protein
MMRSSSQRALRGLSTRSRPVPMSSVAARHGSLDPSPTNQALALPDRNISTTSGPKPRPANYLYTDASIRGCGAFYLTNPHQPLRTLHPSAAFSLAWSGTHHSGEITHLELFPVLHALRRWGSVFSGSELVIFGDNQAAVGRLEKGSARGGASQLQQDILGLAEREGIKISPRWILGRDNELADRLSRRDRKRVVGIAPRLGGVFDQTPAAIRPLDRSHPAGSAK